MKTKEELQKELNEKLRKLNDLKTRKPKKHCGHKEYSSEEDVAAAMQIEEIQAEIAKLRAQLAR